MKWGINQILWWFLFPERSLSFCYIFIYFIFICMSILPAFMPGHHACACLPRQARRGWPEKVLDPLGPELQTAVSCYLSTENGTGVLWRSSQCWNCWVISSVPLLKDSWRTPSAFLQLRVSSWSRVRVGSLCAPHSLPPLSLSRAVYLKERKCVRGFCSSPSSGREQSAPLLYTLYQENLPPPAV